MNKMIVAASAAALMTFADFGLSKKAPQPVRRGDRDKTVIDREDRRMARWGLCRPCVITVGRGTLKRRNMQTHVFLRSPTIQTRSAALGAAVLDRLNTLDPGESYAVPTIRFLPDTTPRGGQWRRPRAYYGQSLHGTDWPDRWVAEWGQG